MKPEAIDAFTTDTMRPEALEAAKAPVAQDSMQPASTGSSGTEQVLPDTDATPADSSSESTAPTATDSKGETAGATTLVAEVLQGAKSAVDDALTWAEKKVGSLGLEQGSTGPYDSPATCMPSDLDAIASGILPAMPSKKHDEQDPKAKKDENEDDKCKEEGTTE
ncbi:hypothetical protein ACJQWK_06571 [Exserohilum turcicum]|uniref:Uncharacterized protein n=1 Tax=Exserohilum turcicum (strain 28A) TaxID=671987 RepID=R0IIH9_EXST2|nr:uncharacterized protein SETTUDRAFT_179554 [Exserohilum turcica Et28A]EOA84975.1 hypothetical protein SETTUDRAFT_179554 [Exserohilum turcica Et28A]